MVRPENHALHRRLHRHRLGRRLRRFVARRMLCFHMHDMLLQRSVYVKGAVRQVCVRNATHLGWPRRRAARARPH